MSKLLYVPTLSVGLRTLSWSVELDALEDADTEEVGGRGPAMALKLVSLADF